MPVSNKKIAYGYNEAIRHLKETQESFQLIVELSQSVLRDHVPAGGLNLNLNMNLNLNQFVTALSENLFLVELSFWYATMDQPDHQSLNRLFQIALPLHPSLKKVSFLQCQLNTKYVMLFAAALAAPVNNSKKPQLQDISLEKTNLDLKGVRALSNMLRNNAWIECLTLNDCKVNSEGCRILFESLDGNTHLKELRLDNNAISKVTSTSVMALANAKNLQKLSLRKNQMLRSEKHIQVLLRGLRTNLSLRELDITRSNFNRKSPISSKPFEELLTTFNFTLQKVVIDKPYYRKKQLPSPQQRVNDLLLQNGPVRKVHLALENKRGRTGNYRLPPRCLWPNALGRISSKPSLLYRFVRQGNLDAFLQHQLSVHSHIPRQAQGLYFWSDKYFETNNIEHVSNDIVTVCDVDYSCLRREMIQHGWAFSGLHLYVLLILYGMQKLGEVLGVHPISYFLSSLIWLMLRGRLASWLYSLKMVFTGFALGCLAALSCVHPLLPLFVIAILVLASGVYWRCFIYRILQEPHVALTHEGICYVSYVQGYFESIARNDSSTGTTRFLFAGLNLWSLMKPLSYGSDTMHIPYGTITACEILVLRKSPEVLICVVTHTVVDPENPTKLYIPGLKKPFGFKRLVDSMAGLSSPC